MTTTDRSTIVGVFEDPALADRAINELRQAGFSDNQIGFAVRKETINEEEPGMAETKTEVAQDTAKGVVAGGVVGGTIGALAALLIPGIGPVLAGGILVGTLSGAAVGVAAGGLIGALVGMGVPEEEAHYYHREFEAGRIIVTVRAGDRMKDALDILRRNGALEANSRFGQSVDPGFIASSRVENVADAYPEPEQTIKPDPNTDSFFEQSVRPGTDEPDYPDNLNFPRP